MASKGVIRLRTLLVFGNYHLCRSVTLSHKAFYRLPPCPLRQFRATIRNCSSSSTVNATGDIQLRYENGLPVFSVPLPSRRELCQFTLKPISNTVGDLITYIQEEDHGVDRVAAYTLDGERIAKATTIDILLQSNFHLVLNDQRFEVRPPIEDLALFEQSSEQLSTYGEVKSKVAQLYSALNLEEHQVDRERHLLATLETLRTQIEPLEQLKQELEQKAKKRTHYMSWVGLGMMSVQFGILARLTWWEYSWDIMEPVTYFVTIGTSMAMFAYYVCTKQEYNFEVVRDREFLLALHKNAKKAQLDVDSYNQLRSAIYQTEYDLRRLRDPLQLQLPIQHLMPKKQTSESDD